MAKGLSAIKLERFFEIDQIHRTREHGFKLKKNFSNSGIRHYFFSERVVSRWNSLPPDAVESQSINGFKSQLTKLRRRKMGYFMDS